MQPTNPPHPSFSREEYDDLIELLQAEGILFANPIIKKFINYCAIFFRRKLNFSCKDSFAIESLIELRKKVKKKEKIEYELLKDFLEKQNITDIGDPSKNFNLTRQSYYQLIKKLQQGDEILIGNSFFKHGKKCIIHLHKRGSYIDDAKNATTDALLEIQRELFTGKLIKYGNVYSYFLKRCILKYGQNVVRNKLMFDPKYEELNIDDHDICTASPPEESFLEDRIEALKRLVKKLKPTERELINYRFRDKMQIKDIAEKLGSKPNNITQRLRYIQKKLRKQLREDLKLYFS